MGFGSLVKKAAGDIFGAADKISGGFLSGGMLGGSALNGLLKASGLLPGDVPDLNNAASEAEAKEMIQLAKEEKKRREEAKFMTREGAGVRRRASISLGDDRTDALQNSEEKSIRATGRFNTNRLIL